MTPERWQQVKDIFDHAVECAPASRMAYIRERCGDDEELRREVESLLGSDTGTGSLLDNPLVETAALSHTGAASKPAAFSPAQNDSFGPYVPIRLLGEGGMGTVYLARQVQPIRREVALKVVKLGMDSRQVLERFEMERQALALIEYPNVARVLDAGTSERGRPYFVMEYVDGVPITRYCDRKALNTRERLQLFIPVCNALQHAHKKGIIHRDVKPSNVLVAEVDGKPVPKVIDFGIARATEQRSAECDAFTLDGQMIGTPEYMSPEQARLDSGDIDTGTDVYSLGIVLYELLVGALPLDIKSLRKIGLGEMLRAIRETPVPTPTARITQMGAAAEGWARLRSTDTGQLKRDLAGDLDWIVMKAIDKDRHGRYASASEFAADIERYLKSQPVLAGPPGAAYRARKFVVRHQRPVAAAVAVVLVLIAGIITTTWEARVAGQERAAAISEKAQAEGQRIRAERQAIEAGRQRDAAQAASKRAVAAEGRAQQERNSALTEKRRADGEAATAMAVNDFLQNDLLAQASAVKQVESRFQPDPDLKVRTALDRAAARISGKFHAQPLVEASIRYTVGDAYENLGQYREAQQEFERALELRRHALGEEHPDTLRSMEQLGSLYGAQGRFAQAERLLTKALELSRRVLGEEHRTTIDAMSDLGGLYMVQRRYPQAEPLLTKALELNRRVLGEEHFHTKQLGAMVALPILYFAQGKYAQAESLLTRTLELSRRVRGEDHPDTVGGMYILGMTYEAQGKYAQAEPLLTAALDLSRRVSGEDHPHTAGLMNGLGITYQAQGKYDEAEPLLIKALELSRREERSDTVILAMNGLGMTYQAQGKYTQAEPLLTEALELSRSVLGEEHPATINAMSSLVVLYLAQGKYEQAGPLLVKAVELDHRVRGTGYPGNTSTKLTLASLWLTQRNYDGVEPLLREALSDYAKLPDGWMLSGINYFSRSTTIILPGRVASPINVTEIVDVVMCLISMEGRTSRPRGPGETMLDGFQESIDGLVVGQPQDLLSQRHSAC